MVKHTAIIENVTSALPKMISGEFSIDFETGGLNFNCHTQNVEFGEVRDALIRLRDEIDRQIINQQQCPFHTP